MTRDYFKQKGLDKIPLQASLLPVSVPGVVDGWDQALKRFGRMTLGEVLQPAIEKHEEIAPDSAHVGVDDSKDGRWRF
jgi:gamma-glutamyltranspeptidase